MFFWFRPTRSIYSDLRRNEYENRRWRGEYIVRNHGGRSWYTRPGKLVRTARPTKPLPAAGNLDGIIEYDNIEYAIYEAQEFKTVHYKWERKDYFNRRSGRYLYSEKFTSEHGVWEMTVMDGIGDIEGKELLEEQR